VDRATGPCATRWHSKEIAPSVVAKLSRGNGLVYTYTKDRSSDNSDGWYLTALDWATGRTVYKRLAGEGLGFNNNYAPVTIGADGTAYVGVLGGLVALRDATAPTQTDLSRPPAAGAGAGAGAGAPQGLRVGVRLQVGRRSCIARVTGPDRRLARSLTVQTSARRTIARDRAVPLRVRVRKRNRLLRFVITVRDGRRAFVRARC
jgi:hypothetical protein